MKTLANTTLPGSTILVSSSGSAILGGAIFGLTGVLLGAIAGATIGLIASIEEKAKAETPNKSSVAFTARVSVAKTTTPSYPVATPSHISGKTGMRDEFEHVKAL